MLIDFQISNNVLSYIGVLAWVKMFKYLGLSGFFRLLVRVIEKSARRLVIFSCLLLVLFVSFSIALLAGLGHGDLRFSDFKSAFSTVVFMLLGSLKVT